MGLSSSKKPSYSKQDQKSPASEGLEKRDEQERKEVVDPVASDTIGKSARILIHQGNLLFRESKFEIARNRS